MLQFKCFLDEETNTQNQKLKHLTHLEDHVIHGGHKGVEIAAQHLDEVAKKLHGDKSSLNVSTKYDGAPSIVFGTHPQTGKFFVATKSAFNKNPKINYTPEDIDENHGHSEGLSSKLKAALTHLPKIMPRSGGVFQGDLMHTPEDIETKNGMHHFTPNTITYSVDKDSAHGKAIKNSKLGVVVHTKYTGKDFESMGAGAIDAKTRSTFENHPDVHNIDPTININPSNFTPEDRTQFEIHKEAARKAYTKMKPEAEDALVGHGVNLEAHINKMVRENGVPSVDGYIQHLNEKSTKAIDSVKTESAKAKKAKEHSELIQHIEKNRNHFEKALEVHSHLQKAKDVLTRVMAKNNPFMHSIAGETTGPEGAVAVDSKGNMSKFVNRAEFSRQNFLRSKMGQPKQQVTEEIIQEKSKYSFLHHSFRRSVHIEPRKGEDQIPVRTSVAAARNQHQQHMARKRRIDEQLSLVHHMTWMRGNPIHQGHEAVINQVMRSAEADKGSHSIILTHSHDNVKNPLTPEQKLKHAKRAFPDANISVSDKNAPTILHHAVSLHANGVEELHLHVGSDRVEEFSKLLHKYNGQQLKNGYYNFKKINVIPVGGDRAAANDGVDSYSATKMRKAAVEGDRDSFHKMAPRRMTPEQKDEMMQDVQNGLKQ